MTIDAGMNSPVRMASPAPGVPLRQYALAVLACIATTAIAAPLSRRLDLANVVMLYPLAVLLVAVRLGRGPAVLAAFASVALFDFFLVPPYYTFAVADIQYVLTFAVMLVVALITGHLAAGLRQHAEDASRREERVRALYEMARELVGAHTLKQIDEIVRSFVSGACGADAVMLLQDGHGGLKQVGDRALPSCVDEQMARLAGADSGFTDMDASQPVRYCAMKTAGRLYGVLAFVAPEGGVQRLGEHGELMEAVASLASMSVARAIYAEAAVRNESEPKAERLSALLSFVLHEQLGRAVDMIDGAVEELQRAARAGLLPEATGGFAESAKRLRQLRDATRRFRDSETPTR